MDSYFHESLPIKNKGRELLLLFAKTFKLDGYFFLRFFVIVLIDW